MAEISYRRHRFPPVIIQRAVWLVRAVAGEPLLPILLRRTELLPQAAVRPLVTDALAPAAGRGATGGDDPVALIQESLSVAHNTGALATRDLERVVVDTTVQPKPWQPPPPCGCSCWQY